VATATTGGSGSAEAPAPVLPATVTDYEGNEVTVADVSRIIPLNGDIAEIIFALGMGGNVVATDVSATYPAEAVALPKIGYQRQLAAEGILALTPTLVIGTETAGPPEVLEQLAAAGVTVLIYPELTTIEDVPTKLQMVAEALGVPEAGEARAAQTVAEIEAAQALLVDVEEQPSAMFLYVRGTSTQMIGGAGTAANSMIEAAGAIDAGAESGIVGYQPMTAEALAAAQPDVLILLTAGLESVGGIEGLLEIPGVAQTPAGQDDHILDFDDLYFLGMGPRTGQALHDLILGLHPELE
jgi:iron complex transport system substrate-binding protein